MRIKFRSWSQQAVRRGARRLDRKVPGWANLVDPASLSLLDPWRCVLGQLARNKSWGQNWTAGLDRLGLDPWSMFRTPCRYGFEARFWAQERELVQLWTEEINKRTQDRVPTG